MSTLIMHEEVVPAVEVMKKKTLLERLGGEKAVVLMLNTFFDELTHQIKLFRTLLGPEELIPKVEDIADYMLVTHTHLFRKAGLDVTHFDLVAQCLIASLQSFLIDQVLIDECIALLVPLRTVFDYGAKVAAKEKDMDEKEKENLPICSAKTIGTNDVVILPVTLNNLVPAWLPNEVKKVSNNKTLRDWTACLSDRCCSTVGDKMLSDCLLVIPYLELEPIMNALMILALISDTHSDSDTIKDEAISKLLFPHGKKKGPLPRILFDRLVVQFNKTCNAMDVHNLTKTELVQRLRSYRTEFPDIDPPKLFGLTSSHPLAMRNPDIVQVDTTTLIEKSNYSEECGKKRSGYSGTSKCIQEWSSLRSFETPNTEPSTMETSMSKWAVPADIAKRITKGRMRSRLWFGTSRNPKRNLKN